MNNQLDEHKRQEPHPLYDDAFHCNLRYIVHKGQISEGIQMD